MRLIRNTGVRVAKIGRYRKIKTGLYHCKECGNEVQLPLSVGRNHGSCGCLERSVRLATVYRPQPAERTCLMCGEKFVSRGPHNRRCGICEHKVEVNEGTTYYMPPVYKQKDKSVVARCEEL